MAHILLIHGAWHDGSCWDKTAAILRKAGHDVACPDLPIHPGTTLADCVAALPVTPPPLVVAHSMGGMIAEAMTRPVKALVHLCSYLPLAGDSLSRLDRLLPAPSRNWPQDEQGRLILPDGQARQMMYHDSPAERLPPLRPQPTGPMRERLTVRRDVMRHYILCENDRAIPPALQRAMVARATVDHLYSRPWGHSPFLSDPAGLAQLIDSLT